MRLDGVTPVLSMPFNAEGDIELSGLFRQIDYLRGSGIRAVAFGFGSEVARLSEREALFVLEEVCRYAEDIDVVATSGGGSHRALLEAAKRAADVGADLLMIRPTLGSASELVELFGTISSTSGLHLVLQDAPEIAGVDLSMDLLTRLVTDVEGIAAVKVEGGHAAQRISALAQALGDRVSVLGGFGGIDFINELERGASGTVPFVAFSREFVEMQREFDSGAVTAARDRLAHYIPILVLAWRSMDTALWTFKELLRRKGVLSAAYLRAPSEVMDSTFTRELDLAIADLNRWGKPW